MEQTVFIASYIDIDDWPFAHEAAPHVAHVMASFDDQKLEALKRMATDDYIDQFDVLQYEEWIDEIEAAVWHTGGWIETKPFGDAAPKILGRQEWTLASPEWDISDPDKRGGIEPILRLVVEQHRVF